MKRFLIDNLSEVALAMHKCITDGCLNDVMFVGLYDDAVTIIKELLMFDEPILHHIIIKPEDWDGYNREYYITLDKEMNIWCEEAYDSEKEHYLYTETECVFVADDCNSALLKKVECDGDNVWEVAYDLGNEKSDCDCDGNCACCNCNDNHEVITRVAVNDDGKLRGFEKSWNTEKDGSHYHSTYSFFSNNPNIIRQLMENFDIKF